MPSDLTQLQQVPGKAIPFDYGISRRERISRDGQSAGSWVVNIKRQGLLVKRAFFDRILGGREAALALAIAWRDAMLRLIPPVTRRQTLNRLRTTNSSGVPGVSPRYERGQLVGWTARLSTPERCYSKTFSCRNYGESAKQMAIAERERLLEQYGPTSFSIFNSQATQEAVQHFGFLLDGAQPTVTDGQLTERIRILNQWFDQLCPEQLYVRLMIRHNSLRRYGEPSVLAHITSLGMQERVARKILSLEKHSYRQRLPEFWQFFERTITAWYGRQYWLNFAACHQGAFLSSTEQNNFQARHYSAPSGYPQCLITPAPLLPMLEGFELPDLPYWAQAAQQSAEQARDQESDALLFDLAVLPPVVQAGV